MVNRHWAVFGGFALCALCGCSLPSQTRPVCSWAVSPPSNSSHLCTVGFTTLRTLARAETKGDDRTVRRLVTNPAIALRIIGYGRHIRAIGATNFHVVPDLTLDITKLGLLGASSFLGGSIPGGHIREPFTLYMRVYGNGARVVAHDPGLAW